METTILLYSIIDLIGKQKIRSELTSDIESSRYYIEMIMANCEKRIEAADEDALGSFCEGLLHFMLTVCSLPSTRKVQINNTVLDIVIPNLRTLKTFPNKALVIYIVKKTNDMNQEKINTVTRFQPEYKNLWLISKRPLSSLSSGYINYIICPEEKVIPSFERRNFRDIIVDIQKFLKETGDKSLRFFQ
jgi:hypothetical protein